MIEPSLAVVLVEAAREEIHRTVVVYGAHDGVEVHGAVKEAPGDVALERAQERVDG